MVSYLTYNNSNIKGDNLLKKFWIIFCLIHITFYGNKGISDVEIQKIINNLDLNNYAAITLGGFYRDNFFELSNDVKLMYKDQVSRLFREIYSNDSLNYYFLKYFKKLISDSLAKYPECLNDSVFVKIKNFENIICDSLITDSVLTEEMEKYKKDKNIQIAIDTYLESFILLLKDLDLVFSSDKKVTEGKLLKFRLQFRIIIQKMMLYNIISKDYGLRKYLTKDEYIRLQNCYQSNEMKFIDRSVMKAIHSTIWNRHEIFRLRLKNLLSNFRI